MSATSNTVLSLDPSSLPSKRIPELDGARGLAIAFVLLYHYANLSIPGKNALYYALLPTHLMWSGVDLFFVLRAGAGITLQIGLDSVIPSRDGLMRLKTE
jgi:uncharacterized membrane protein